MRVSILNGVMSINTDNIEGKKAKALIDFCESLAHLSQDLQYPKDNCLDVMEKLHAGKITEVEAAKEIINYAASALLKAMDSFEKSWNV